eukprot:tig00021434_g21367.t1
MLSYIERRIDGALVVAAEVAKGTVKEAWRAGTQLLNGGAAAVLHLIHPEAGGKYYLESRRRIHRHTSERASNGDGAEWSASDSGGSLRPSALPKRSLLRSLLRFVVQRLLAFLHLAFPDLWRAVEASSPAPSPAPRPAASASASASASPTPADRFSGPRTPPRTQSSPALAGGAFRHLVTPDARRRRIEAEDIVPALRSDRPPRRRTFGRSPDSLLRAARPASTPPTTIPESSPPPLAPSPAPTPAPTPASPAPADAVPAAVPVPSGPASSWTGIHSRPTDRVFAFEKNSTGLFEDLQLSLLIYLDLFFGGARALLRAAGRSLRTLSPVLLLCALRRFFKQLWTGLRVFRPSGVHAPAAARPDRRSVGEIVRAAGYVHEAHTVVTDDGYLLTLDRIARPESRKVVLFQHGLLDTSFAWISTGTMGGLAFRAWDMGYDVFLGNFRGTGSRGHVNPRISHAEYWDFSVNEHYDKDVPAFVRAIRRVKTRELASAVGPSSSSIAAAESGPPSPPEAAGLKARALAAAASAAAAASSAPSESRPASAPMSSSSSPEAASAGPGCSAAPAAVSGAAPGAPGPADFTITAIAHSSDRRPAHARIRALFAYLPPTPEAPTRPA